VARRCAGWPPNQANTKDDQVDRKKIIDANKPTCRVVTAAAGFLADRDGVFYGRRQKAGLAPNWAAASIHSIRASVR